MKHITYSDKSVLIGDEIADLLIEYAAELTTKGEADTVFVHAISSDGDEVEANFLIGPGAPIMSETTTWTVTEPDNAKTIEYIRGRLRTLTSPNQAGPLEESGGEASGGGYEQFGYDEQQ